MVLLELKNFKFYIGKAQRADYKHKLKDAGQEDLLRQAEDLEDKLDGVDFKLADDGHEESFDEELKVA
ncbi:MAG: hypothetical protein MMC33_005133 [Icmadophila ericetorum]|nr:hypothetical protein [Icmadophila ericetorum]